MASKAGQGLSNAKEAYDYNLIINSVRKQVEEWRAIRDPNQWGVTPETARLLQHWRHHQFSGVRPFKGDDRKEAEKNNEAARRWISGLEAVNRKLGLARIFDLSATPFFLRGSGYAEGTLFPWTMSDFSLMDAIECGIVKLPRVPVAENIVGTDMPMFRFLWDNIRAQMPKKGVGKSKDLNPNDLAAPLQTALEALYGHYEKTFKLWADAKVPVPPCFIIVCNNTSTSKLVYDFISGFQRKNEDGTSRSRRLGGFIDDTLYGFTFGGAVHQPNKIYSIDLETGVAQFVANQSVTLEPVFAAFSVARVRHHTP